MSAMSAGIGPIDHVAVAVRDLEAAVRRLERILGTAVSPAEEVPAQGVRVAFFATGGKGAGALGAGRLEASGAGRLELIAPTGPETPVGRFLERRGEGMHHVAFRVADVEEQARRLKAMGVALTSDGPVQASGGGRAIFVHPRETGGVLIELYQPGEEVGSHGGQG